MWYGSKGIARLWLMFTDRIDKRIGELSARAFKAVVAAELGEPGESDADRAQRELLITVKNGRGSQLDGPTRRKAVDSGLIEIHRGKPHLTPLGNYLLSLEVANQPERVQATEQKLA